jgi:two-component system, LuxR family, response regulator FixJ
VTVIKKATISLVDDDRAVLDSLELLIRSEGFDVSKYASAESLLAEITPSRHGCVVTDVRMPDMSGLDLLAELKRRDVSTPVIVITGHADVPLAVEAMKKGAVDFLEKPFDGDALLASIRNALILADTAIPHGEAQSSQRMVEEKLANLTKRETEVLAGLMKGQSNKIIAYELRISARTVEVHRSNLMTKMGASSLPELVRMTVSSMDSGLPGLSG